MKTPIPYKAFSDTILVGHQNISVTSLHNFHAWKVCMQVQVPYWTSAIVGTDGATFFPGVCDWSSAVLGKCFLYGYHPPSQSPSWKEQPFVGVYTVCTHWHFWVHISPSKPEKSQCCPCPSAHLLSLSLSLSLSLFLFLSVGNSLLPQEVI